MTVIARMPQLKASNLASSNTLTVGNAASYTLVTTLRLHEANGGNNTGALLEARKTADTCMIWSIPCEKGLNFYREFEKSHGLAAIGHAPENDFCPGSSAYHEFLRYMSPHAQLRYHERNPVRSYRMISRGESGIETGVPGKIIDGDPSLEYSNECECDKGGVWQICC